MGWIIYAGVGVAFYAFIIRRWDEISASKGLAMYLLLIAFSIAGAIWLSDGKGVSDGDYRECGTGSLKYEC